MQRTVTIYNIFPEIIHWVSFRVLAKGEQNDGRVGGAKLHLHAKQACSNTGGLKNMQKLFDFLHMI